MAEFEPIRVTGIIDKEVTKPRRDGTEGSALYNIPFQLSARPPHEWAEHLPKAWENARHNFSHRPRIASVSGDRIWLSGTTLEEVQQTHKETLEKAVAETNKLYVEFEAKRKAEAARKQEQNAAHERHVQEAAKKIKFE